MNPIDNIDKSFLQSKSWAFQEAIKIYKKIGGKIPEKGFVLFETGYGPSGLPHMGTFGEVVRTVFVMDAFKLIAPEIPVKLVCVSDDYDALRKVPTNLPNTAMLTQSIGLPLTYVPDPFEQEASFAHYMNKKLRMFLDSFEFEYEFISATESYENGLMNDAIRNIVKNYDKIMNLMLPTLGPERQATYSPLMPKCNKTGKILAEGVRSWSITDETVTYINAEGEEVTQTFLDGNVKLQWKIDFGSRWASYGVDYEVFGKDHAPNEKIYKSVCKIAGGLVPTTFVYEMFLGEDGSKISKSKGNGSVTVESWMRYAPFESLKLFMFQKPQTAKRLFLGTIPQYVDDYLRYVKGEIDLNNPAFFINPSHSGLDLGGVTYSLVLNLASACNPESDDILWGFIRKYNPSLEQGKIPFLDKMISGAVNYYNDVIKPSKVYVTPNEAQVAVLKVIRDELLQLDDNSSGDDFQQVFYDTAREFETDVKTLFKECYQILLGTESGPRMGSFIKLFGKGQFIGLINSVI